jgi:hypothetical protein
MNLRRALLIAACLCPIVVGRAAAQFQPIPQTEQAPPCVQEFTKLRDEAQKRAGLIRAAGERKAPAREACKLFDAFSAAEVKMIDYATENSVWCGIPPQILENIKQAHTKTTQIRNQVCQAAAAPQRPAGPSLSDTLSAPVPDSNNIRTGRGTFDTLTGTPLGPK